jgi:hypothetical protein
MAVQSDSVVHVIAGYASTPQSWERFLNAPIRTLANEGVELSRPEIMQLLSIPGASDSEARDVVLRRLAQVMKTSCHSGKELCGG